MVFKGVILVLAIGGVWPQAAEALSCYSCSGDECVNGADLGTRVDCNGVQDSCYTKFDGYLPIARGCVSSLIPPDQCTGSACETCSTDYCNVLSVASHKCVICSSVLDEKCISDPGSLASEQCGAPSMDVTEAQCYSRVIGTVTERGCVQSQTDLDTCDGIQCSTCTGSGCNNAEFPENRQKCAQCDSQTCNNAPTEDTSYCNLPDDSCVTVKRGDGTFLKTCEQSMPDSDRQFCQSNSSACSFCTQYECNKNVATFPAAGRQCYTCEGTDCLHSSLEIGICHDTDDQCFTIFDGYNPVSRGCRSTLTIQDKAICDDSNDVDCSLCADNLCNLKGREDHRCAYCSSVVDGNCIVPNDQLAFFQCPAPTTEVADDAQCYTRVIGTVTERGCLGSATDDSQCDPAVNCEVCAIQDGIPCNKAIFPADRRKCVVGTQPDQYCPDPWDDCVQIASNSSAANVKKCQSSMSAEEVSFCKANSNKCDFCESDNCNQEEVSFDYIECVNCDSDANPACTANPSSITEFEICDTCVTLLTNSSQGQQILQRSCLTDLSPEDAEQCTNHNSTNSDAMCTTCSTNRCNNGDYPEDRLACFTCTDGSCFSHDSIKLEFCPIYRQGDSCFSQRDSSGALLQMGCLSSLNASEQTNCNANPNLCQICSTPGCNDPSKQANSGSCIQCDSALDVTCVGRASTMDAEPCNDPLNTHCYTRLVGGRTTVRGCLSDLDATDKDKCAKGQNCTTCDSSSTGKCNVDIYPADRLECYTCLQPPCLSHDVITPEYCPIYSTTDRCIMLTDTSGIPIRLGCNSTLNATEQSQCQTNSPRCMYGSKSRSNDPTVLLGTNKCVQCTSSNHPDCMGNASALEALPCNDPLNTRCYSRFVGGTTTERGCFNDLDSTSMTQCQQGTNCAVCSTRIEKCNSEDFPRDNIRCYQCNSTTDSTCKNAQSGKATHCPSFNSQNQCYILVQKNGDTVRKCSTQPRATECGAAERCEVCHFSGCNHRISTAVMPTVIAINRVTNTTTAGGMSFSLVSLKLMMTMIAFAVIRRLG